MDDAKVFVGKVVPSSPGFQGEDMTEFNKPAGPAKATIASVAGVLKPGKAVQVSIQDTRWLEGAALRLPRIKAVSGFLNDLLGLPGSL